MQAFFSRYRQIPPSILKMIMAAFLIHMINASFILVLNIFLRKMGYEDGSIARFNSFRFMGVMLFAFPLGLFIKGKLLKPFLLTGSIMVPLSSIFLLFSIRSGHDTLITLGFLIWGSSFMIMNVCSLPYIMRSAPEGTVSEAISLNFSSWSLATIVSGSIIGLLSRLGSTHLGAIHIIWDEFHIILAITSLSAFGFLFILGMKEAAPRSKHRKFMTHLRELGKDYDWLLIGRVLAPNMIIAIGAGLTIPFVNLFFNSVFHLDSDDFSLIGALTASLVFVSTLTVPIIRRRFGFRVAILIPQWSAILFLLILASTQLLSGYAWAFGLAVLAYVMRQPLMNMAGPMTSELGMKYVGPRNQELISAMSSSIWSASWFVSAKIFQLLREWQLEYYQIFFITAILYAIGVGFYHLLIRDFLKRETEAAQLSVPLDVPLRGMNRG